MSTTNVDKDICMQIESQQFLQIIARKQTQNAAAEVVQSAAPEAAANTQVTSVVEELLAKNAEATIYSIADEAAKANAATNIQTTSDVSSESFEKIAKPDSIGMGIKVSNINYNPTEDIIENPFYQTNGPVNGRLAITIEDFSPSRIANIKQIIYDLHFKDTDPDDPDVDPDDPSTDPTDPEDPDVDPDDPYVPEEDDEPKPSFIDEFDDVETMFDWMHEQDPTISKTKGLTREQLIQFTQNDDWEDSNFDFFGSLNRIWDVLNKNDDDYLTVDEIKELVGEQLGSSSSAYKAKVATYAQQLQDEFDSLDLQGKLEYAIEMTRDYLEAAGLTEQLKALDRLLAQEDLYNEIHVGNIAIADLNTPDRNPDYEKYTTLGAYAYNCYLMEYNGIVVKIPVAESDREGVTAKDGDLGLTLDLNTYAYGDLFEFIDTLVHELTHATAASYSNIWSTSEYMNIDQDFLDRMYERGALTDDEYEYYSENINRLIYEANSRGEYIADENFYFHFSDENLQRFYYLCNTMWDEYLAYQTDADYADSIGADEYDGPGQMTTAVDGPSEKDTIISHINAAYDGVPEPDWKWWTYA